MHDVLSNWFRRAILHYLQNHDDPVDLTAVIHQLVIWHRETEEDDEQAVGRAEELRPWILREHVLEMKEFGVLGYDPEDDTIWIPDNVTFTMEPP